MYNNSYELLMEFVKVLQTADDLHPETISIFRFGDQVTVTVGGLKCINSTVKMIEESDGQIGRFVCVVPMLKDVKGKICVLVSSLLPTVQPNHL